MNYLEVVLEIIKIFLPVGVLMIVEVFKKKLLCDIKAYRYSLQYNKYKKIIVNFAFSQNHQWN